ncbi:alpha/beta fold hydrolase [Nocardia sp. CDC160]|uniref:alpha/beta fold hydrolase n=1 Tax=Nocardia sp. CDC160 TaxID=3112166 RepID=UPI002DBE6631|nr:alpha/beta hydrolase [Nocardia sp. CDC160]MEC3917603.1 alpha/beta hydrolase [Nocardia sp. CDC160]
MIRSDTLRVPGATLYYEVRGDGPLVLFIPGGGGDAGTVDPIAELLEDRFTVASLDPRGYSRSVLDGPQVTQRVEVQSDDVYRLLCHLGEEPVFVVGGSSGGIVGLDLLARHPERVARLVVHEPPLFAVLPDADEQLAMVEEVDTLLRTEGLAAANARFLTAIGNAMKPSPAVDDLPQRTADMWARLMKNGPLMMEYEFREFTSHRPDFAALSAVADKLVLAVGRETRGLLPSRPAVEIARRLGLEVTEFPGAHNGMRTEAPEIAEQLAEIFTAHLRVREGEPC